MAEMRATECEWCRSAFLVPPSAGAQVQCPACLMVLRNPFPPALPPAGAPAPEQVQKDVVSTTAGLFILAAVFLLGIVVLSVAADGLNQVPLVVVLMLLGAVALPVVLILLARQPPPPVRGIRAVPAIPVGEASQAGADVLAYGTARQNPSVSGPVQAGPFVGGFFAALGLCAGIFLMLGSTIEAKDPIQMLMLGLAAAAIVLLCMGANRLGRLPPWSGVGRGVTVGLALGMMAVGPCAGCYILFLFS